MSRLEELLLAWEDQTLDEKGREELKRLLSDPNNRADLVQYLHTSEMILTFFSEQHETPQQPSAGKPPFGGSPGDGRTFGRPLRQRSGKLLSFPRGPLAVAASMLLVLGLSLMIQRMLQEPVVARIGEVQGRVQARSDDLSWAVESGMKVRNGVELMSRGRESGVLLRYADGSWVRIDGDARITVRAGERGQRVDLHQGRLLARLQRQRPGRPFVFSTAHALATVLGTRLMLEVEAGATELRVDEGRVRLTRLHDGKSIEVEGGHTATAGPDIPLRAAPSVVAAASVRAIPKTSGLVAHLGFEGSEPEKVSIRPGGKDESQLLVRLRGAGDAGLIDQLAEGKKGQALAADRTAVSIGHHEALATQRLSLALWFRVTAPKSGIARPILLDKENAGQRSGFVLRGFDGDEKRRSTDLVFAIWTDQGRKRVSCTVADAERWNHVAVTFDGFVLKLFCNGERRSALEIGDVHLVHSTERLTMGRFIGLMDEVRFYDRALSDEEVGQLAAE